MSRRNSGCTLKANKWQPTHRTRRPLPRLRFDDSAAALPEIHSPSSPLFIHDSAASPLPEIHRSLSPSLFDDAAAPPLLEIHRSLSPSLFDDAAASPLPEIHRSLSPSLFDDAAASLPEIHRSLSPSLFDDAAASLKGTPISSSVAPIHPNVHSTPCTRFSSFDRMLNGLSVDIPGNSNILVKIDLLLETMLNMDQWMEKMDQWMEKIDQRMEKIETDIAGIHKLLGVHAPVSPTPEQEGGMDGMNGTFDHLPSPSAPHPPEEYVYMYAVDEDDTTTPSRPRQETTR
ncbi:uncharacterized protein LOC142488433 isoform X2 [Ascaphus truei]|uniref:uncharacterized protein LOC142488433 isoform X2 n=1 Tax=Ascaphus truei TaxID=8439 RepID=UPI003F59436C